MRKLDRDLLQPRLPNFMSPNTRPHELRAAHGTIWPALLAPYGSLGMIGDALGTYDELIAMGRIDVR